SGSRNGNETGHAEVRHVDAGPDGGAEASQDAHAARQSKPDEDHAGRKVALSSKDTTHGEQERRSASAVSEEGSNREGSGTRQHAGQAAHDGTDGEGVASEVDGRSGHALDQVASRYVVRNEIKTVNGVAMTPLGERANVTRAHEASPTHPYQAPPTVGYTKSGQPDKRYKRP